MYRFPSSNLVNDVAQLCLNFLIQLASSLVQRLSMWWAKQSSYRFGFVCFSCRSLNIILTFYCRIQQVRSGLGEWYFNFFFFCLEFHRSENWFSFLFKTELWREAIIEELQVHFLYMILQGKQVRKTHPHKRVSLNKRTLDVQHILI